MMVGDPTNVVTLRDNRSLYQLRRMQFNVAYLRYELTPWGRRVGMNHATYLVRHVRERLS